MANSDRFYVTVLGSGGHGSMPQHTRDPVLAASQLVVSCQQIVSRNTNPTTPAVVSFGGIVSNSNVPNVIPDSVQVCGTCRTYSDAVRIATEQRLGQICQGTALSHGVQIDFNFKRGYDAVVNDSEAVHVMKQAASQVEGAWIVPAPQVLSGEDFFYYGRAEGASSCFCFVGCALPGELRPLHHPAFDFDERALSISVQIYLKIVQQNCL